MGTTKRAPPILLAKGGARFVVPSVFRGKAFLSLLTV